MKNKNQINENSILHNGVSICRERRPRRSEERNTQKGITLIALIITIIVLLILAIVSIRLVMNDGILGKAESGVKTYSDSETEEKVKLAYSDYQMGKLTDSSYTFEQALQNGKVAYTGVTGSDVEGYIVTVTLSDGRTKQYNVTSTGVSKIKDLEDYGLKVGYYVAYDATKDENGNTITGEKATYTSYSASNASSDKNDGRSSGYASDQVFNLSSYTGGWRVLGVKNGQLQLISADIIGPDSGGFTYSSVNKYCLRGKLGVKYGVAELNAIAGMYGQGKGASEARSIDVDDVNKITGYKPEETGDGKPFGCGEIYEYGNKVTYFWDGTNYTYYEYGDEESKKSGHLAQFHSTFNWYDGTNWQSSRRSTTATTSARKKITELKNTCYRYYPTTLTTSSSGDVKGIASTSDEWKLLFGDTGSPDYKNYWLASPYIYAGKDFADFGLRDLSNMEVQYDPFYDSMESSRTSCVHGVRPIVTLKSDIQIDTTTNDGLSAETAYEIK